MKYTILGFQQQKLMDLGLKTDDALILRTIKDMYSSAGMEFITKDNERYMWLNQKYFIQQIPIIGSRSTLLRKIENMAELGLLVKLLKHSRKGQRGNFSYIKPTMLLDSLQDYDPYVNLKQGLCQNDTSLMSNRHNKDTSIKDTSIKDNKEYCTYFEKLWTLYPAKKGKGRISNSKKKELYKLGDEFERCITRYIDEVEKKRLNGFKELQYQNGSTFFNSGYVDYLDENYKEMKENGEHRGNNSKDEYSKLGWSFEDMQGM